MVVRPVAQKAEHTANMPVKEKEGRPAACNRAKRSQRGRVPGKGTSSRPLPTRKGAAMRVTTPCSSPSLRWPVGDTDRTRLAPQPFPAAGCDKPDGSKARYTSTSSGAHPQAKIRHSKAIGHMSPGLKTKPPESDPTRVSPWPKQANRKGVSSTLRPYVSLPRCRRRNKRAKSMTPFRTAPRLRPD